MNTMWFSSIHTCKCFKSKDGVLGIISFKKPVVIRCGTTVLKRFYYFKIVKMLKSYKKGGFK